MIIRPFSFLAVRHVKTARAPVMRYSRYLLLFAALGACSQASEQDLLDRARVAFEQGNDRAAEIDTRTALQQNPDNAEGRRLLGEVYLFQQNPAAAADEFQRSLDAAENDEVRVLYARALLAANRGESLLELHAQSEFSNVSTNPHYLAVLANAQAGAGQMQNARESLAAAVAASPDDPVVATTNALFQIVHSNRAEDARANLLSTVALHPDYADAWSLLGGIQQMNGELAEAEASYQKAVQLNPYRFSDRINLITARIDQGKTEEANNALQRLLSSNPNHPGVNYLHGRMLVEAGENVEALTALAKVLSVQPDHAPSLYLSAIANIAQNNLATARGQLDRLLSTQRDHISGHLLLSNLHLLMGNPADAEQGARSILRDNPMNYQAMALLATALNAQGRSTETESIALYRTMIEVNPQAVEPRLALGTALLQTGDGAGGVAQFQAAHDLDPDSALTWESLIQAQLVMGYVAAAKTEAETYARQQPQNPRPAIYLARIALQENDLSGATEYFGQSEEILRRALADDPDNRGIQGLLIDTLMTQGKLDEAGTMLADLPDELANAKAVLVARARIALAGGRPAEAEPLLRAAMADSADSLTVMWLGGALKAQGREGETVSLLEEWLAQNPADVLVHFELASTFMQQGREQDALEHYQTIVESGAENVIVLNNLAWLIREDNPQQALIHIQRADQLAPNNPPIMDTYAMVQLELGATSEALSLNQRALDRVPADPSLRYHRALILRADGQAAQAIEILQELVAADGVATSQREEAQELLTELQGL
jgi:cellulose synthase operon protein C